MSRELGVPLDVMLHPHSLGSPRSELMHDRPDSPGESQKTAEPLSNEELASRRSASGIRSEKREDWLDADRVEALKCGDNKEWEELKVRYRLVLIRALKLAYFHVNKADRFPPAGRSLQTILNDGFSYFYERFTSHFREFKGERAFCAFLFRAMQYFAADEGRKQKKIGRTSHLPDETREEAAQPAAEHDPSKSLQDEERGYKLAVLNECLLQLPQKERSLLQHYFFGKRKMTLAEVGELLGMSPDAARKRYQRSMKSLEILVRSRLKERIHD